MPATAPPLPRLLRAQEVASMTGLPLSRVYELSREHLLPSIRLGRAVRYDPAAVAAFLANGGTRTES